MKSHFCDHLANSGKNTRFACLLYIFVFSATRIRYLYSSDYNFIVSFNLTNYECNDLFVPALAKSLQISISTKNIEIRFSQHIFLLTEQNPNKSVKSNL